MERRSYQRASALSTWLRCPSSAPTFPNMTVTFMKACRAALFLGFLAAPSVAQKTILLGDSLAANADRLRVDKGTQWSGLIPRWRFGDYAVASSRAGWTTTTTKSNLFNTETESNSTEKFSFVLTNKTTDSAMVNAAHDIMVQALRSLELGNGWSFGTDELVQEADNFTALITINRDTTETWALFMGVTRRDTGGNFDVFLTNGVRRISLSMASSNRDVFDLSGLPALGYEFAEDGHSIGAVQYFAGSFGPTQFVWIRRGLDAKTKLVLAAAMTALLQVRSLK